MKCPHSGHRERMRARYLRFGPEVMSDVELAEIALYSVLPRCDTRPLAQELVCGHGGFPGLALAPREELIAVNGAGEYAALFIEAARAVAARAESQRYEGAIIRDLGSAKRCLGAKLAGVDRELLLELCVDDDGRTAACVPVHEGPFPQDGLNISALVEPAVRAGTRTVILAHNRPSAAGAMAELELGIIRELADSLRAFDVELVDYLIFFNRQCVSAVAAHILPARRRYDAPFHQAPKREARIRTLPEGG